MKKLITISFILITIMLTTVSFAWEQDAHIKINMEAVKKFNTFYANDSKYKNAPIDMKGIYKGIEVSNSTKFETLHKIDTINKSFAGWVVHGGFSSDEPHLYASVRHFYDPTAEMIGRSTWLTDQITIHGNWNEKINGEIPNIDAKEWALSHPDNPYNFKNALEYYYKAMTIKQSDDPENFTPIDNFRSKVIEVNSVEDERSVYLASAFRALGETMHLMADMAQPAHVRNDAHPFYEPLEQTLKYDVVRQIANANLPVEPRVAQYYLNSGSDVRYSVDRLFKETATFTNENFFSADTIYDEQMDINPKNNEWKYPSPQLSKLTAEDDFNNKEDDVNKELTTYYGQFFDGSKAVALARVGMIDALDDLGLVTYALDDNNYNITPSMAKKQGEILIPAAIAACSDLIDRFFPTLILEVEIEDARIELDKKNNEKEVFLINAQLKHHIEKDVEWKNAGLEIKYSGPGSVVITEDGKVIKRINVNFEDGEIVEIQNYKSKRKMVEGPLVLFAKKSTKTKLTKEEAFFEVSYVNEVIIEINAGGRLIKSDVINFDGSSDLNIEYQPKKITPIYDVTFEVDSDAKYYYEWDLDDGDNQTGSGLISVIHKYEAIGDYTVSVTAYTDSSMTKIIGEGSVDLVVEEEVGKLSILPSSNLDGMPNELYELTAEPEESIYKGLPLEYTWQAPGASVFEPNGNKMRIEYDKIDAYDVSVTAIDPSTGIRFEGFASITIEENIEENTENREKVWLEFDKDSYMPGEYMKVRPNSDNRVSSYVDYRYYKWSVFPADEETENKYKNILGLKESNYKSMDINKIVEKAPILNGRYTIVGKNIREEGLEVVGTFTVEPKGYWQRADYRKAIAENISLEEDSGTKTINSTENSYNYNRTYQHWTMEMVSFTINSSWSSLPEKIIPGEIFAFDYSVKTSVPNGLRISSEYEYVGLRGYNDGEVKFHELCQASNSEEGNHEENKTVMYVVPGYGNNYGNANKIELVSGVIRDDYPYETLDLNNLSKYSDYAVYEFVKN